MNSSKNIQFKLQHFITKFYINELIRGVLLFFSFGLLYFIFTLFIEYFLWLKPDLRTFLFWIFVFVELVLLVKYIGLPILKLLRLKKGISTIEASKIIGKHFLNINDKLLNMLQLQGFKQNSELIIASIEQKAKELQPIPFKTAIDFSKNKKYLKYALLPLLIWMVVYITGNIAIFNDSFSRVVHYNKTYNPPAPFSFKFLNHSFNIIEGESFTLKVETVGNIIPEDVKINFSNENYYLKSNGNGKFEYLFSSIKNPINFYLEANGIISSDYQINIIATPIITNLKMVLNYPTYTQKQNEVIQNTGNAVVPQGTKISWQIETHQTENVIFNSNKLQSVYFDKSTTDYFSYTKQLFKSINYTIATSNKQLKNHESLNFTVQVISDEFPKIIVKSDIDSVTRGPVQFLGQISDDYGIKKLQLVYYNKDTKKQSKTHQIDFQKGTFSDFYYVFPDGLLLDKGIEYEIYFEVFDNDVVNGSKKTISKTFSYYNKTEKELKQELLKEEKETLDQLSNTLLKSHKSNKELQKFKKSIQNKPTINWNDSKKMEQFVKRQTQYQQMFQHQTNQLKKYLLEQPKNKTLKEQKEDLLKRIEETKKLAEQEKMLEELQKLTKKLNKEDLIEKLKKISKKNKRNQQSLERILELTKRFYVEQKANQIQEKLQKLAKKQNQLSKKNEKENTSKKQQNINDEFNETETDLKELNKQNKDLKRPMDFPNNSNELKDINNELNKALNKLNNKNTPSAKKNQKSASKKMKQLSEKMEMSMIAGGGEQIDENIEDLRKIVENLIEFSFQQETLLTKFSNSNNHDSEYPKNIRKQQVLKEYFEHIDDSLYMLSLRLVKMSSKIQKEVSDAHYYIDEALLNFTENRFNQGVSNQQFVMTAANNLANMLSDLLESLMNATPSLGQGKGNSQDFNLPDIIKKQGKMIEKMMKGMKSGKSNNSNQEQMNGEIYEIYKQQSQLREALKELLKTNKGLSKSNGDAIKQMEELEQELLEKGFTKEVLQKMQQLQYELLKLEEANLEQGKDNKRKSKSNLKVFQKRTINKVMFKNQYFNQTEILHRQSLPLRKIYKKKLQEYYKDE